MEPQNNLLENVQQQQVALQRINLAINSTLDLHEILQRIIIEAVHLLVAQSASVTLHDDATDEAELTTMYGQPWTFRTLRYPLADSLTGWVARHQRPLRVPRLKLEEWPAVWHMAEQLGGPPTPVAVLLVPLWLQGQVAGSLEVVWESSHVITDHEEQLLEAIALQAAIAVTNARLYQEKERALHLVKESEDRYRSLFENANDAIVTFTLEGIVTAVNRGLEALLGWSRDELIGRHYRKFVTPASVAVGEERTRQFLTGQRPFSIFEVEFVRKDGGVVPVEARTRPILNKEGYLLGIQGIYRDITERKWAQEALRQSEERFFKAFHASPGPISISTFADGRFLDVNARFLEVLGYRRDEMIGRTALELGLWANLKDRARVMATLAAQRSAQDQEFTFRTKAGESREVLISRELITLNGESCVLALVHDITERKRAAEALQQEVQISTALARVGQELIVSLDTPALLDRLCQLITEVLGCDCCHVILWQPERGAYVAVAGYGDTPEQWEALQVAAGSRAGVSELLARLDREKTMHVMTAAHQELLPAAFLQKIDVTVALWVALRRGEEFMGRVGAGYRGRTEPFTRQQERIASGISQLTSLALEDVRPLEELRRANRLKSDFLATMSHELRTPLNVVVGYTDLLLEGDRGALTVEQCDLLQRVRKAAYEELELIVAMMDVSRLEAGRLPVELTAVDVAALIEELRGEIEGKGGKPGVTLVWQMTQGLPPLRTDRTKLRVVLKNLLSNAMKFTDQGSITMAVRPLEGGVEFRVADTGGGIPPEVQAVMFEMFRQGNGLTTRCHEGVGLGLYIVRRLLELLGGTVSVESEVGKGSTFRVWTPQNV